MKKLTQNIVEYETKSEENNKDKIFLKENVHLVSIVIITYVTKIIQEVGKETVDMV